MRGARRGWRSGSRSEIDSIRRLRGILSGGVCDTNVEDDSRKHVIILIDTGLKFEVWGKDSIRSSAHEEIKVDWLCSER